MNTAARKLLAEFVGTFLLVFLAVGAAVFGIAAKVGRLGHPACYHVDYRLVADAVQCGGAIPCLRCRKSPHLGTAARPARRTSSA